MTFEFQAFRCGGREYTTPLPDLQEYVFASLMDQPVSPIVIIVGSGLLINFLGYSAVVGLGVSRRLRVESRLPF